MPFTLSHPAAAVPLARLRLPLSALVVGSMAPDFPYFVVLNTNVNFAHTLPGLVLFCVPAGLAVLWLYHRVVKRPVLDLFPLVLQRRLASRAGRFEFGPLPRLALVALAVFAGALTHVAWDGFTNYYGWAVRRIPYLREVTVVGSTLLIERYALLHYLSTSLGMLLLLGWSARWMWRAPAVPVETFLGPVARGAIGGGLIAGSIAIGLYFGSGYGWFGGSFWHTNTFLTYVAVGAIAALTVGLVLYSGAWHVVRRRASQSVL